jgi:NhaP-type Na+/H+ or K+/H+ antiporter
MYENLAVLALFAFSYSLIGVGLARTDAALGKAVVSNPDVPAPVRESLNVESGLNDGICVPILFTFLALATHSVRGAPASQAIRFVLEEIGIGLLVGVGLAGRVPFRGVKPEARLP